MPTASKLALLLAGCLFCAALAPSIAVAGDANSVPPRVELQPAGTEGFVGPRMEDLAYFSTPGLGSEEKDWEYAKGSKVTFACSIDARPVRCPSQYVETFEGGNLLRAKSSRAREKRLPGPFYGYVPMPKNLPAGPHTVTVVATDEDGTDLEPPSITVTMDRTPPAAPQLTQVPPRRSRIRKPIFRFSASDDIRLVRSGGEIFTAALRRLKPTGAVYRDTFANSFLEVWGPRCPTLLTCSTRAQASYMVNEHWYSYGEPERLIPGLYELRVRARDAVGNKSPLTTYRFRILRGKPD
jgi:hypothetical protein